MAKKRSKRRRTASTKQDYPGWLWMIFGLAIGLSVALAIYVRDREPAPPAAAARKPASLESAIDDNSERARAEEPATEQKERRFTFYALSRVSRMRTGAAPNSPCRASSPPSSG